MRDATNCLDKWKIGINGISVIETKRFPVGMPSETLIPKIDGYNSFLVFAFQIPQIISPHIGTGHSMTHQINQVQFFRNALFT